MMLESREWFISPRPGQAYALAAEADFNLIGVGDIGRDAQS